MCRCLPVPPFVLCCWIACRVDLRAGDTRWQFVLEHAASMCSCWCPARHVIQRKLCDLYVCQVETSNTCSFTVTVWWRHNATDAPQILKYRLDNTENRGLTVDSDSGLDDEDLAGHDWDALEAGESQDQPHKLTGLSTVMHSKAKRTFNSDDEQGEDAAEGPVLQHRRKGVNSFSQMDRLESKVKAEAEAGVRAAAEAEAEAEVEVEAESEDISQLDNFGPFFDEENHGPFNPLIEAFRHNHAPSDTFLSGVPPGRLWRFSQVVKDKDVALMNATASDDVCPKGELVAHTNCIAHAYMHLQKMAAGTLPDKDALGYALSWLKRIDENNKVRRCAAHAYDAADRIALYPNQDTGVLIVCVDFSFVCVSQVPSSTPVLVQLFLDMVGENENLHPLPKTDMFRDRDGTYQFKIKIEGYLQGMSTRACANIFTPQGGGAGSNNATESQNKVSHKQMPVKRGARQHIAMLLQHMQLISLADCDFGDVFRNDIWHHDLFIAVWHLMHFVAFPGNTCCIGFNVMLLAIFETLSIDRLDPAKIVYVPKPGDTPAHRVMDISQVMQKEEMRCLMIPSYRTLHEMVRHHAYLFRDKQTGSDPAGGTVQRIKTFLQAPCQRQAGKSATGPSWIAQATALFNGNPAATVRKMNLQEWMARSHTMAVLVPLTEKADITRYLLRFQTGIPHRNIGTVRPGNGCVVNWEKVPATIYYCLCGDHALRGVCMHVLLWLMTHDIVQAPAKWSCDEQNSAVSRGRPSHFKAGSALVREPVGPAHVQPSRHALSKMAGGMSEATSLSVTLHLPRMRG